MSFPDPVTQSEKQDQANRAADRVQEFEELLRACDAYLDRLIDLKGLLEIIGDAELKLTVEAQRQSILNHIDRLKEGLDLEQRYLEAIAPRSFWEGREL